ncbi:hypothetical protein M378DRAFT_15072 [Amanita muscaria Koide BX008]|uniref:Cytochrome c oxidase assembly protein COX20, mitochondrial n=1 Tax=Amanita muscaria (strain Koide BX008) TaxID=946122 RepID=A0A0C2S8G2_AMAMK|nr:hypothetical protein M378DRAFT_15072 [Amanita muscaria Koide BX008]
MSTSNSSDPNTTALPSRVPAPTGNLVHDIWEVKSSSKFCLLLNPKCSKSVKHITDIPCARDALMNGIAGGAGIGFVRGLSAGPLVAGHWAMATFTLVSIGSWHICQKRIADERKSIATVIESAPRRIKRSEESNQQSPQESTASIEKQ